MASAFGYRKTKSVRFKLDVSSQFCWKRASSSSVPGRKESDTKEQLTWTSSAAILPSGLSSNMNQLGFVPQIPHNSEILLICFCPQCYYESTHLFMYIIPSVGFGEEEEKPSRGIILQTALPWWEWLISCKDCVILHWESFITCHRKDHFPNSFSFLFIILIKFRLILIKENI